jgi:hypothetical protein
MWYSAENINYIKKNRQGGMTTITNLYEKIIVEKFSL